MRPDKQAQTTFTPIDRVNYRPVLIFKKIVFKSDVLHSGILFKNNIYSIIPQIIRVKLPHPLPIL